MTLRLGVLGAGGIGSIHADAAYRAGSVVAAVWDPDVERAAALAARCAGAVVPETAEALVARDDLDAVVVAAPNAAHVDLAVLAMRAGRDVLLEKPMALSVQGCREILRVRDQTGRKLQLGFVTRGAPAVAAVRARIDAGEVGRPYHVRAQLLRRRGIPGLGGWFTTKSLAGGGVLVDLGVHLLDLVLDLTGRPQVTRVSGACSRIFGPRMESYVYDEMWAGPPRPGGTFDVEDGAVALLRCGRELTIELSVAWASDLPEGIFPVGVMVLGDRGGCWMEPWGRRAVMAGESEGRLIEEELDIQSIDPWDDAWTQQHRLLAQIVKGGAAPTATGEHGLHVQEILEAIYRSSDAGMEIALTP